MAILYLVSKIVYDYSLNSHNVIPFFGWKLWSTGRKMFYHFINFENSDSHWAQINTENH